ncbi:MAG: hypothetical protein O6950_11030 [Gammaproteobacteria bacterium]|nr:hypothetical protein [Gammaproteobacteria bacterium]
MTVGQEFTLIGVLVAAAHISDALTSINAIMYVRTAQGAIAWAISLVTFPYLALPPYWIFGRRKFSGYIQARRSGDFEVNHVSERLKQNFAPVRNRR